MTDTQHDLSGRTALITGGSRGIGLAVAAELLSRGASVTITGRNESDLQNAVTSLGAPDRVLAQVGHAGRAEAREAAVAATVERFGSIDILVNNAGTNPLYGKLVNADLEAFRKIFDLNVVAALGWVQAGYHAWMGEHGGVVINMASTAALRSTGVIGAYGASKAALIRLTEELAWQLGPKIRVNAVAPAVVKTKFAESLYLEREEETARHYPARRLGEPEDVARLIGFLVSDAADWINGETVRIDGGLLATGALG